jgi:hypothetical protein
MTKIPVRDLKYLSGMLKMHINKNICLQCEDFKEGMYSIGIWNEKKHHYEYSSATLLKDLIKFISSAAYEALGDAVAEATLVPKGK